MNKPNEPTTSRYVTRHCQHCGGGIEFDTNELDAQNSIISCPHCGETTSLSVPALPPPIIPPVIPPIPIQPQRKSQSNGRWIIAASGGALLLLLFVVAVSSNRETPEQKLEAELKSQLITFRETFGLGSYDLILSGKNSLVSYCRNNRASLTNYTADLDEICTDLDSAIVPWKEDVPESEFQRRADVSQRAMDNIAILIERSSHDDERLQRAINWKANQDIERAKRARQR